MASVASHGDVSDSKSIAPAEIDEDLESCITPPRNEEEQEEGSKSARN